MKEEFVDLADHLYDEGWVDGARGYVKFGVGAFKNEEEYLVYLAGYDDAVESVR